MAGSGDVAPLEESVARIVALLEESITRFVCHQMAAKQSSNDDDVVQIIPATNVVAVYRDEDGGAEYEVPIPLWGLTRIGEVLALDVDDQGNFEPACGAVNFVRLEVGNQRRQGPTAAILRRLRD